MIVTLYFKTCRKKKKKEKNHFYIDKGIRQRFNILAKIWENRYEWFIIGILSSAICVWLKKYLISLWRLEKISLLVRFRVRSKLHSLSIKQFTNISYTREHAVVCGPRPKYRNDEADAFRTTLNSYRCGKHALYISKVS